MSENCKHRQWVDAVWGTDRFPIRGEACGPNERYGLFVIADTFGYSGKKPDYESVRDDPGAIEFSAAYPGKEPPALVMLDGMPYLYYTSSDDHRSSGIHFYVRCDSVMQLYGMGT